MQVVKGSDILKLGKAMAELEALCEQGPKQARLDRRNAQELCMRIHLGLNPAQDIFECLRVLHDEGREAFEALRGQRCEYAHEWKP